MQKPARLPSRRTPRALPARAEPHRFALVCLGAKLLWVQDHDAVVTSGCKDRTLELLRCTRTPASAVPGSIELLRWERTQNCAWEEPTFSTAAFGGNLQGSSWDVLFLECAAQAADLEVLGCEGSQNCLWGERSCSRGADFAGYLDQHPAIYDLCYSSGVPGMPSGSRHAGSFIELTLHQPVTVGSSTHMPPFLANTDRLTQTITSKVRVGTLPPSHGVGWMSCTDGTCVCPAVQQRTLIGNVHLSRWTHLPRWADVVNEPPTTPKFDFDFGTCGAGTGVAPRSNQQAVTALVRRCVLMHRRLKVTSVVPISNTAFDPTTPLRPPPNPLGDDQSITMHNTVEGAMSLFVAAPPNPRTLVDTAAELVDAMSSLSSPPPPPPTPPPSNPWRSTPPPLTPLPSPLPPSTTPPSTTPPSTTPPSTPPLSSSLLSLSVSPPSIPVTSSFPLFPFTPPPPCPPIPSNTSPSTPQQQVPPPDPSPPHPPPHPPPPPPPHCQLSDHRLLITRPGWDMLTTAQRASYEKQLLARFGNTFRADWVFTRVIGAPPSGEESMIIGVLFSHDHSTLLFKLTAYLPPLYTSESRSLSLDVFDDHMVRLQHTLWCRTPEGWWGCTFRIPGLPVPATGHAHVYRVRYAPLGISLGPVYQYNGTIPWPVVEPRVLAMGCFGGDAATHERTALVDAVLNDPSGEVPDIVVLQGDQTYLHTELVFGMLDLMRGIAPITRHRPTLVQLDDHDYGLDNLWGAGPAMFDDDTGDGFEVNPCEMQMHEAMSMGHNPDPARPLLALQNGMRMYFSSLDYGKTLSIAVLESRKFKSSLSTSNALMGAEQEAWFAEWCAANRPSRILIALSQTTQMGHASLRSSDSNTVGMVEIGNGRSDLQSWSLVPFDRWMRLLVNCGIGIVLSGDQHFATAVRYPMYGNLTECASPAVDNTVWWRVRNDPVGRMYTDANGALFHLLAAWNVDSDQQAGASPRTYVDGGPTSALEGRADGFLLVHLSTRSVGIATCVAHGFRTGARSTAWNISIELSRTTTAPTPPLSQPPGPASPRSSWTPSTSSPLPPPLLPLPSALYPLASPPLAPRELSSNGCAEFFRRRALVGKADGSDFPCMSGICGGLGGMWRFAGFYTSNGGRNRCENAMYQAAETATTDPPRHYVLFWWDDVDSVCRGSLVVLDIATRLTHYVGYQIDRPLDNVVAHEADVGIAAEEWRTFSYLINRGGSPEDGMLLMVYDSGGAFCSAQSPPGSIDDPPSTMILTPPTLPRLPVPPPLVNGELSSRGCDEFHRRLTLVGRTEGTAYPCESNCGGMDNLWSFAGYYTNNGGKSRCENAMYQAPDAASTDPPRHYILFWWDDIDSMCRGSLLMLPEATRQTHYLGYETNQVFLNTIAYGADVLQSRAGWTSFSHTISNIASPEFGLRLVVSDRGGTFCEMRTLPPPSSHAPRLPPPLPWRPSPPPPSLPLFPWPVPISRPLLAPPKQVIAPPSPPPPPTSSITSPPPPPSPLLIPPPSSLPLVASPLISLLPPPLPPPPFFSPPSVPLVAASTPPLPLLPPPPLPLLPPSPPPSLLPLTPPSSLPPLSSSPPQSPSSLPPPLMPWCHPMLLLSPSLPPSSPPPLQPLSPSVPVPSASPTTPSLAPSKPFTQTPSLPSPPPQPLTPSPSTPLSQSQSPPPSLPSSPLSSQPPPTDASPQMSVPPPLPLCMAPPSERHPSLSPPPSPPVTKPIAFESASAGCNEFNRRVELLGTPNGTEYPCKSNCGGQYNMWHFAGFYTINGGKYRCENALFLTPSDASSSPPLHYILFWWDEVNGRCRGSLMKLSMVERLALYDGYQLGRPLVNTIARNPPFGLTSVGWTSFSYVVSDNESPENGQVLAPSTVGSTFCLA